MPRKRSGSESIGEAERLAVLDSYHVVGTPAEAEFDHVVRLAADLFQVPIALVSFVGKDRQSFKARVGLDVCDTAREISFCTQAIMRDDLLVVPDARGDARFMTNPLVTGSPFIRFYAGAPLCTPTGPRIGTVCIIDTAPRAPLTAHQEGLLRALAQIVMDHLERRRLDTIRRAALSMAAATPDAMVCANAKGSITFWNAGAERLFGLTRTEALGTPLTRIVPPDCRARLAAGMAQRTSAEQSPQAGVTLETEGLRGDGARFPIELSVASWVDNDKPQFGSIIRDVSERRRVRERDRYLTLFDRLTGLPNRVQFLQRVDEVLASERRFTVFKLGLDRFKAVNGTLGMAAGDTVLIAAAERVTRVGGPRASVGRLNGDEFGILLVGSDDPVAAAATCAALLEALNEPYLIDGALCRLGASIGVVLCPGSSKHDTAEAVLRSGLLALQHAKLAGGRRHVLFEPRLGHQAEERRRLEEELRDAFARDEFELYFQPQVMLADSRIAGAEALLRWRHPTRGLLSPAAFLPALEASDVVLDVGRWILRRACAFAAEMAGSSIPIRVGVNLFAAHLGTAQLFDDVVSALEGSGLPSDLLELEITETTVLGLGDATIDPLRRLRALGVKVAFDDYGTGYASLSSLKRYPFTRLKIDCEFVRDLESDPDDAAIVKAVVALGANLGLEVIAEGIETLEQASTLVAFGCREAQGYLFGKPMPAAQLSALVTRGSERRAARPVARDA